MRSTKDLVENLLNEMPSLKDDDNRLCSHIWLRELEKMGIDPYSIPAIDFLKLYARDKVTLGPSIKRARAKLQEENPQLRGKKYYIRKGVAQDKWRKDLGYNNE